MMEANLDLLQWDEHVGNDDVFVPRTCPWCHAIVADTAQAIQGHKNWHRLIGS